MENIAEKTVSYKVKPIALGGVDDVPRQRASSTVIGHKTPLLGDMYLSLYHRRHRGSSKGIIGPRQSVEMGASQEVNKDGEKEPAKPKRTISLAKLAELEKARN